MARFLVLSLAASKGKGGGMQPWLDWFAKHPGAVLDRGGPFVDRRYLGPGKAETDAVGFMLLRADDLAAACKLVASSPAAKEGQRLAVLEIMDIPTD